MRAVARTGARNAAAMPPANGLLVRVVALSMDQYLRERLRAENGFCIWNLSAARTEFK
jgi:hypothetical protein